MCAISSAFPPSGRSQVLLAMQKVEGSNPFSRFEKGLQIELFPVPTAHLTF
jgi:hypothetical protein